MFANQDWQTTTKSSTSLQSMQLWKAKEMINYQSSILIRSVKKVFLCSVQKWQVSSTVSDLLIFDSIGFRTFLRRQIYPEAAAPLLLVERHKPIYHLHIKAAIRQWRLAQSVCNLRPRHWNRLMGDNCAVGKAINIKHLTRLIKTCCNYYYLLNHLPYLELNQETE